MDKPHISVNSIISFLVDRKNNFIFSGGGGKISRLKKKIQQN
jgi:hypothetical protein